MISQGQKNWIRNSSVKGVANNQQWHQHRIAQTDISVHINTARNNKKEDSLRHIDYNIENLRQNPEKLKRCIKTTPIYEKYVQIKTLELKNCRMQINNTPTTTTNRQDIKNWNYIVKHYKKYKTGIPQTTEKQTKGEHKVDEKIKSQAEIKQIEKMNTSKHLSCKRIAKAEKIQEQRGETLLRNCIQAWENNTEQNIPQRRELPD